MAKYLIDAKKKIDSMLFINQNIQGLSNIDLKRKVDEIQMEFYIKLCIILDDVYKKRKKEICSNEIIDRIYYERDKDKAHKDSDYLSLNYNSFNEIIETMKIQIMEVKEMCINNLPQEITLDFVPHDKELFRLLHGLNKEKEDDINSKKYKNVYSGNKIKGKEYKVLNYMEDIKNIKDDEKNNYAVIMKNGINIYEGVQERQDAIIKVNLLYNTDNWIYINKDVLEKMEKMRDAGLIDEYGMPLDYKKWNKEMNKKFENIRSE